MLEENPTIETGTVVDNTDYIAAIKELKENSVDRSKYDQLRAENKRLLDSIVNGAEIDVPTVNKDKPTIDELRKKLFNPEGHLSNLEYVETALALRNQLIESGEEDPFVPQGKKTICTEEDRAAAQRVADVFQQCVDYADGDPIVFTNELMRRTSDVHIMPRKKKK